MRTPVERALEEQQLECSDADGAGRPPSASVIDDDGVVAEGIGVELERGTGVSLEPQERGD